MNLHFTCIIFLLIFFLFIFTIFFIFQCNNPLTKESKLDAAHRIINEWTEYDDKIKGTLSVSKTSSTHKHTEL